MVKNYYKILGIPNNSGEKVIKRAFRMKAREFHPDVNKSPGAEEKFKEVHEAYEILMNPLKRHQYDSQFANSSEEVKKKKKAAQNPDYPEYEWYAWDYWDERYNWWKHDSRPKKPRRKQKSVEVYYDFMDNIWGIFRKYPEIWVPLLAWGLVYLSARH